MQSWYSIKVRAEASGPKADVFIYDDIGYFGITAKQFVNEFRQIPKNSEITVHIHSRGGDVFDGFVIADTIAARRDKVEVRVDGWAASMASIIALSGRRTVMSENSWMMIHNPYGVAVGESEDMLKMADLLSKITDMGVTAYRRKTGKSDKEIRDAMDAETWFTAKEAKEFGLADEVDEPVSLSAAASLPEEILAKFQRAPIDRIKASFERKKMETQTETAVDSLPESEKAGFFATLRKILKMETKTEAATPPAAATAPAQAASPTLADLVQQLADFRASVDTAVAQLRAEFATQKTEIEASVNERLKDVDKLTERQANAKSRSSLAALGIPANGAPAAGSTAAAETIVETYVKLTGAPRVKFWRENKAKLLNFRS